MTVATTQAKISWADAAPDERYEGVDIDLDTLTPEQIPELRRREAVAGREHELAMARQSDYGPRWRPRT